MDNAGAGLSARQEGIVDSVEAKRLALRTATRRYLDSEITSDEWRAVRDRCMPDYDAMGRHLYAVSQRARQEQAAAYRRSFWRGVRSLF